MGYISDLAPLNSLRSVIVPDSLFLIGSSVTRHFSVTFPSLVTSSPKTPSPFSYTPPCLQCKIVRGWRRVRGSAF
jgi:hypothetical protein